MSKIQINLELDSNNVKDLVTVANMLLELSGEAYGVQIGGLTLETDTKPSVKIDQQDVEESPKEEAASKKRASRAKPKPEQDAEASEAEETKAEEAKTEEAPAETPASEAAAEEGIKLDDLRASLSLKVKSYREEIKAKLTELGASNLTTLDAGKYADMNDFLKGLK